MASYKGHLVGGIAAFTITYIASVTLCNITLATPVEPFLACLLGSLFPDIDTKSKIQLLFYRATALLFVALLFFGYTYTIVIGGFVILLPLIVPHRSIFHNKWFISTLAIIVAIVLHITYDASTNNTTAIIIFFLLGVYSHLVLDFGLRRFLFQL